MRLRPGSPQALREINVAADAFGVQLQYLEVRDPKDIETAFRAASKERADAVLVLSSPVLFSQRRQIVDLAVKSRLPAIYNRPEYVEDGGLVFYGVSYTELAPARRHLCGQDPERRQTRRSPRRAAEEV